MRKSQHRSALEFEVLTIGKPLENAGQEPFAFLAEKLRIFVRRTFPTACLQLGIRDCKKALPVRVLQRDVNVPGGNRGLSDRANQSR